MILHFYFLIWECIKSWIHAQRSPSNHKKNAKFLAILIDMNKKIRWQDVVGICASSSTTYYYYVLLTYTLLYTLEHRKCSSASSLQDYVVVQLYGANKTALQFLTFVCERSETLRRWWLMIQVCSSTYRIMLWCNKMFQVKGKSGSKMNFTPKTNAHTVRISHFWSLKSSITSFRFVQTSNQTVTREYQSCPQGPQNISERQH